MDLVELFELKTFQGISLLTGLILFGKDSLNKVSSKDMED